MKEQNNRKIVALCYDHLSGILGEMLFSYMVEAGWIICKNSDTHNHSREYEITDKGWIELHALGIDTIKLRSSKRKTISPCIERRSGFIFKHTGAHLGSLLTQRLFELEWLVHSGDKEYAITKKGYQGLRALGIDIRF